MFILISGTYCGKQARIGDYIYFSFVEVYKFCKPPKSVDWMTSDVAAK